MQSGETCYLDWSMLLEYLKVLLSGPPITAATLLVLFYLIHPYLKDWFSRTEEVEASATGIRLKLAQQSVQEAAPKPAPLDIQGALQEAHALAQPGVPAPEAEHAVEVEQAVEVAQQPDMTLPDDLKDNQFAQNLAVYVRNNPGPITVAIYKLQEELRFEKMFQSMFSAQLKVLDLLDTDKAPHFVSELETIHAPLKAVGIEFDHFIKFLLFHEVIEPVAPLGLLALPQFRITDKGSKFINYVKREYPFTWDIPRT